MHINVICLYAFLYTSLLISSLYNIVDQIFIGNSELGFIGNAATSIVFPITIISVAFAWAIGDGRPFYHFLYKTAMKEVNLNTVADLLFSCYNI